MSFLLEALSHGISFGADPEPAKALPPTPMPGDLSHVAPSPSAPAAVTPPQSWDLASATVQATQKEVANPWGLIAGSALELGLGYYLYKKGKHPLIAGFLLIDGGVGAAYGALLAGTKKV